MKIISVNLNNGLNKPDKLQQVTSLIKSFGCDLLVTQEPWKTCGSVSIQFPSYRLLDGNHQTAAWLLESGKTAEVRRHSERWQEICFSDFSLHNVYLSWESKPRLEQLEQLANFFANTSKPNLICGDFNMAPQPEDGMFGDRISDFTKPSDRAAFNRLLTGGNLIDMTCALRTGSREFTIKRSHRNGDIYHRCDLALAQASLVPHMIINYNHAVRVEKRNGGMGLTDHSAIMIDLNT